MTHILRSIIPFKEEKVRIGFLPILKGFSIKIILNISEKFTLQLDLS